MTKNRTLSSELSRPQRLQMIAESVNESARRTQVSLSIMLLASIYLYFTILSATDENLLRNSVVRIPQLNTGISIVNSYTFGPLIFLYIHLQTLFLLNVLGNKVMRFERVMLSTYPSISKSEQSECWDWLSSIPFVQMLRPDKALNSFSSVLVSATTIYVPILLLVLLTISFLRYQSFIVTLSHHFCLIVDVAAVFLYIRALRTDDRYNPFIGSDADNSGSALRSVGKLRFMRTLKKAITFTGYGVIVIVLIATLLHAWPLRTTRSTFDAEFSVAGVMLLRKNLLDVICAESLWRGFCRYLDLRGRLLVRNEEFLPTRHTR